MMNPTFLVLTVLLWTPHHRYGVTVSAQELVTCYQRDGCFSSGLVFEVVTMEDCCDNINGGLGGIGLGSSFQLGGIEGCTPCPIVLGFIPSVFVGMERGVTYSVQAGFLSGKPPQGGNLNLNLVLGTAGARDVSVSPRVQPRATEPLQTFQITLTVDGISQEFNETFSIEFVGFDLDDIFLFPSEAPVTISRLEGTIVDQDGVEFSWSEDDYRENEAPNATMEIGIAKYGILANPVLFRITPLTVLEAERSNIVSFTRPADDDVSPSIADAMDFDATPFNVTFPADEVLIINIADVLEKIPIVDDEIDEAQEQYFAIVLEVLDAVNFDLMTITRSISFGHIVDNDDIQIGFAQPTYDFGEPDFETLITNVTLIKEGGRLSEQTFSVSISVGEAFGSPPATLEFFDEDSADYRILGAATDFISLIFPPFQQNITFPFFLFGDEIPEGVETFRATSTPSQNFPNFGPPSMGGAFASTEVRIIDNDFVILGFESSTYIVSESSSSLDVCVQIFVPPAPDASFGLELTLSTVRGTADSLDFGEVTFSTFFDTSRCYPVFFNDDPFYEDTESFTFILSFLSVETSAIIDPNVATITILDDDSVTIGFINPSYRVSENGGFVEVTVGVLSGALRQVAVSVELSFSDGSAVNGTDFVAEGQVLVFSSSNLFSAVRVIPLDDNETEIDESLSARLSFVGAGAVSIDPASAKVIIIDDELSGIDPLESTELVTCYPTDSCTGTGSEETLGQCCSNLLAPVGFSYSLLDQNQTECMPCPTVIGFANASFAGEERAENYSVNAGYLSGRPSVEAIFTIGLTLETASENDIRADSTVLLGPACLLAPVRLSLIEDGISQESELNERFLLFFLDPPLSNSSLFQTSAPVSIRSLSGEIIDSDQITFALSEEVYEVIEGEDVLLLTILKINEQDVILANPVFFKITPLTVCEALAQRLIIAFETYNTFSPNRADEVDFDTDAITVKFSPGVDSIPVNISVIDDEINEAVSQSFVVYLEVDENADNLNPDLILLSRSVSTCAIIDDDNIQIGFTHGSYSFLEPSRSPRLITSVELVRDGGRQSEQTFEVQVSVGPPSSGANAATLGSFSTGDYCPGSLILRFPPSTERVSFSFTLNFDNLNEGLEVFQANLSAADSFSGPTFQPTTTNSTFQSTEIHILDFNVDMPDTRVTCYMKTVCSGDFSITTRQNCCNNLEEPLGFSYQSAEHTCEQCPTEFGFSPSNFTGEEQGEPYRVQVGYLSGRPSGDQELTFNVVFINGTAGDDDVTISTVLVMIQATQRLVSQVFFTLRTDSISQEGNETFSIELNQERASFVNTDAAAHLNGVVIDQNRVAFELSAETQTEATNATMRIRISKTITLANSVLFRVTPLTVDEAERRADIVLADNCPSDEEFSPRRADKADFDGSALNVTFPADESKPFENVIDVFINIFDDEVDEADQQCFITYLELLDAVDFSLITITLDTALCFIVDNDDTVIGFAEREYTFNEPDTDTMIREVTLIREGGGLSEQTFGVEISVDNNFTHPAMLELDYSINRTGFLRLQFPAEVQNITFDFLLKSDTLPEGMEAFRATSTSIRGMGFPTFESPQGEGAFNSTEIFISDDNDRVVLGFVSSEDIVLSETQSGGAVQLEFGVLEGYLSLSLREPVFMNATFSTAGGEHHLTTNFTLTGNGTLTINVSLMEEFEDREVDSTLNETYSGLVTTRAPYPNIVLVNNTVMIVIVDDDVEIGFISNETEVSEGEQAVLMVQVLDGQFPVGVTVNVFFETIRGNTTDGKDYIPTTATLTFNGTQSHHSINISIIEDHKAEGAEEFFGVLSILNNSDPRVQLKNPNITITIMANEAGGGGSGIDIAIPIVSAVAVATFILLIFLAVIIICARKVKKSKNIAIKEMIELDKYESSSMRVKKTYTANVPKNLMINSCNLQLNDPVGQGEFGIVYKARLSKGFNQSFGEVVAVKTLKGFLEESVVRDLLKECTKMSTLDHPNVLTLIGVCVDGGPAPYIVMPFMFNGSLLAHLKKERENLVIPHDQQEECDTIATSAKLMGMSLQVAKGMEYLASKRLIHRDLAARNCMIDMNFVIKVADFGLSESTGNYKDYFRQEKSEGVKLPVKWLAPECLSDGVFSEKSDVWAFGVTCWEIFSGGKVPYAGINPMELPRMLENGYRMEMPNNSACTDAVSKMMTECWATTAKDRPTFCGVVISFSENLESISGYMGVCEEKMKT